MLGLLFLSAAAAAPAEGQQAIDSRCWTQTRSGAYKMMTYKGDRACVALAPSSQFEGLWVDAFEGSAFYVDALSVDELGKRKDAVWLTIDGKSRVPAWFKPVMNRHVYRLRFLGRAARDMNRPPLEGYGHLGMSPGLILVDDMLQMRDLGPLPDRR
jgi:hypothetical protein